MDNIDSAEDALLLNDNNPHGNPLPGPSSTQHSKLIRQFDPLVSNTNLDVSSITDDGDASDGHTTQQAQEQ